jgi:hypothetical protein
VTREGGGRVHWEETEGDDALAALGDEWVGCAREKRGEKKKVLSFS